MTKRVFIFLVIISIGAGIFVLWFLFRDSRGEVLNAKLDEVTVRLKWLHQAQFAGHYVADQKGFYEENGMKTILLPFDYEHFPITEVVSGKAQFGVTGADELLIARSEGKRVVALATIYQKNPVVAYALKGSGISTPQDFVGKRVGMEKGVNVEYVIRAMLAVEGVNYDTKVIEVPIGYDAKPLINGEVDIATGYIINEPIQAQEAGFEVTIINPSDYAVNIYADVIFTTEQMIEDNPELVSRFITATLKGWEYALRFPEEAVEFTLLYNDPNNENLNYKFQLELLKNSIPLIKPARIRSIGQMNYHNWKETISLLHKYNIIPESMEATDVYTTKFLSN